MGKRVYKVKVGRSLVDRIKERVFGIESKATYDMKYLMSKYKEDLEWDEKTGELKIKTNIKLPFTKEIIM